MLKRQFCAWMLALVLAALPSALVAQTSPGLTKGQVLTAGQWNALFAGKQDTLGYTPINAAGGVFSGRVITAAPGASTSGLNLTPGSTPASPSNGDLWVTSSGFFARVNGITIGPIAGGSSDSFAATTPITVSFPSGVATFACPTCGVTGSPLSQFASTTSLQLLGVISDETGTGALVFGTAPTLTSAILVTPTLGVATATSINKVAVTAPASAATLTIANGKTLTANSSLTLAGVDAKTLTVNNSLTMSGTDGTVMTFPGASDTVVTLGAVQSLTSKTLTASSNVLGGVTMTLGSDATGDIYYRNAGGVLTRLPIGVGGQALTVSGGLPTWAPVAGTGTVTTLTAGTGISFSSGATCTTACTINNTGVTSVAGAGLVTGAVTTTGSLTVTAATQSDQETATSTTTAVTPGVQKFHPGMAKAWARFTAVGGTIATQSAYNSTMARNGTGDYTISFTTPFSSSTAYGCTITSGFSGQPIVFFTNVAQSASSLQFNTATSGGSNSDTQQAFIVCFGDQ